MSTLKTNTLSNVAGTASTAIENAINGSAKAWVNFRGTDGVINGSYNVSSVTDNGTGLYTVNFVTPMANINYSVVAPSLIDNAGSTILTSKPFYGASNVFTVPTTGSFVISTSTPISGVFYDACPRFSVVVFS